MKEEILTNNNHGWVSIHRKLANSDLWLSEKFTKGQAWVDLILLANHKKSEIKIRGNKVVVGRGEVGWSEEALALRWRWSRGKVSRFKKWLKQDNRIDIKESKVLSVITILNYNEYQQIKQQTIQQMEQQKIKTNNDNKSFISISNNNQHHQTKQQKRKNDTTESAQTIQQKIKKWNIRKSEVLSRVSIQNKNHGLKMEQQKVGQTIQQKIEKWNTNNNIYNNNKNNNIYIYSKNFLKKERGFSREDLTEEILKEIAEKYEVSLSFVKSKLDDLDNYTAAYGKKYKNYKAALSNFVKLGVLKNFKKDPQNNLKFKVIEI